MVSPGEWGSSAWELLHGLAERVGNQSNLTLMRDEKNELRFVLRYFGYLLPCKTCQEHYRDWLKKYNPEPFLQQSGEFLQDSMREWVFKLHEDVNQRREVVSGVLIESLRERYTVIDLRKNALHLKGFYQRGIQLRIFKPDEWKLAWKHLDLLLRYLGV